MSKIEWRFDIESSDNIRYSFSNYVKIYSKATKRSCYYVYSEGVFNLVRVLPEYQRWDLETTSNSRYLEYLVKIKELIGFL